MANQQLVFADTIAAMKKVINRADDASDSDQSITQPTNRGNKLKRKAKYLEAGRLDALNGPTMYRKKIVHAGFARHIIYRNPSRLDEDGDLIEYDDGEDIPGSRLAEENPYGDLRLEELLHPLTSAADLPTHPSMSQSYNSRALTEIKEIAESNQHREKTTLAQMSLLLTNFRGDRSWAPGSMFISQEDETLLADHRAQLRQLAKKSQSGINAEENTGRQSTSNGATNGVSTNMEDENAEMRDQKRADGHAPPDSHDGTDGAGYEATVNQGTKDDEPMKESVNQDGVGDISDGDGDDDATSQQLSHRMTTRAKANQSSQTPQTPQSPNLNPATPLIHQIFQIPPSLVPDVSCGLPFQEADELRKLLVLYVQKQEEVVRQTEELTAGLMRAERMRKDVLRWAKAEAHVGEMSDGEDWYDKEEWGLTEDLLKGKEEPVEEDDSKESKKTRGRRN